jgi:hypothetical protein
MSQENLDLVRSIYAAWERGDFSRTTGLHPEITWAYVGGPEPSSGTGMAGIAAPMLDWLHAWDEWHIEATEYRELDGERVLVFVGASAAANERIGARAPVDGRGRTCSRSTTARSGDSSSTGTASAQWQVTARVLAFDRCAP